MDPILVDYDVCVWMYESISNWPKQYQRPSMATICSLQEKGKMMSLVFLSGFPGALFMTSSEHQEWMLVNQNLITERLERCFLNGFSLCELTII